MEARRSGLAFIALLALVMGACTAPGTPPATGTPAPPTVALLAPPTRLCSRATQLRLEVRTSHEPDTPAAATWTLVGASAETLSQGTWRPTDGPLLIPFPDNHPLPGGRYELRLDWGDTPLAGHAFEVASAPPRITRLDVSLLPQGQAVDTIPATCPTLFVNYGYADGCIGTPYWLTVQDDAGRAICAWHDTLTAMEGGDALPCYQAEGTPLAPGTYTATLTLADDITHQVAFAVAPPPTPMPQPTATPSATPRPPRCTDPFVAAGLTPTGEPFLPLTLFDWYTQVVYVGVRCRGLAPGQPWQAMWYHQGDPVRTAQGTWQGPAEGVVWDSLTGVPEDPFLRPGTYTVTLQIADTAFNQTFNVYAYPSTEEE